MPRRRASLCPSKVKFTSSIPWRSAAAPNSASAQPAAPLKRIQSSRLMIAPRASFVSDPSAAVNAAARKQPAQSRALNLPSSRCYDPRLMLELGFDPFVAGWFAERFRAPTPPQEAGWRAIADGRDTLIAAPTGSGKTLAAFLWAIDRLVRVARTGWLEDRTTVVYVSPLKALGNDIQKNLEEPLAAIRARALAAGHALP